MNVSSLVCAGLAAEPGLGVLTAEAGLGKTTLMRHLCDQLPAPEHRIVYLCDTGDHRSLGLPQPRIRAWAHA